LQPQWQNRGVVRGPHAAIHGLVRFAGDHSPFDLRWTDLEQFVLDRRRQGFAPNTVHGYAQVLKTLCRQGHRMGYIPEDITTRFELPRVPGRMAVASRRERHVARSAACRRETWGYACPSTAALFAHCA